MAIVHLIALQLYLYWRFWWLDIPMHVLGGAVAAFGVFAFRDLSLPGFGLLAKRLCLVMLFVVLVMIAWEVFEVWAGIPIQDDYVLDTSIDLTMGFIGGLLGYVVARNLDKLQLWQQQ